MRRPPPRVSIVIPVADAFQFIIAPMKRKLLIVLGFIAWGGCAATLPRLTPNQVSWASQKWPGSDEASLASGRQLYLTHCSGCHSVIPLEKYSSQEWSHWLDTMAARAHLPADGRELISRYIEAAKSGR